MKKLAALLLTTTLATAQLFSQQQTTTTYIDDPLGGIRDHNLDFISLDLDVRFAPEDGKVTGTARYVFEPLQLHVDSVFLDGPGILVQNITVDDVNANFRMDSAGITVFFNPPLTWEKQHRMAISYDAYPKRGIYFVGWKNTAPVATNDPDRIRKQIWTQGQGIDNRHWIPSYDGVNDKLITGLNITFDKNYTVISNGNLIGAGLNNDNTKTWHYRMEHPHTLYLIMLAIGEYAKEDYVSKNGVTSSQYYYPDRKSAVEPTYRYSAEMMDWMVDELKVAYPWRTYANVPVQEFIYGAMENTTATIFSDFFYQDEASYPDKNYVAINAHELTHQWFGDYVSAWGGAGTWLQESFATYYAKKFRQHVFGEDAYQWIRYEEMQTAFNADSKNNLAVGHSQSGSPRVYQKGSIVLDMLRYVTGDEQFKKVITEYLLAYPYENVQSSDLEMQFMKTLGMNLDWFFDEWIYRGSYPEYTVSYTKNASGADIMVRQTHAVGETIELFKMPVHVQVHYVNGNFDDRMVWIEEDTTLIRMPGNGNDIAFVLFDPGRMILSKVNFQRTYEELRYQAFNAELMIDRLEAIQAMRATALETKKADLNTLYQKETFHAIRSEIVSQLIADSSKEGMALIKQAISDKEVYVRRAVINNSKSIPKKLEKDYQTLLLDPNYTNAELALTKLSELNPDKKSVYLDLTKNLIGANKNIRIAWLEIACGIDKEKYIGELVNYCSSGYEFRTRVDAINSIEALNYCSQEVLAHLFNAACASNNRLAGPARSALNHLKETTAYGIMIKDFYRQHTWDETETQRLEFLFQ